MDTSFLVRLLRAVTLARDGRTVRSPLGDLSLRVQTLIEARRGFEAVILARVAASANHAPRPAFMAQTRAMLTKPGSPAAASMLRDPERGARTEHEHVLGGMLALLDGMSLPLLRVAYPHLQAYEVVRQPVFSARNAAS